ncbi:MAG: hypothetical protein AAF975_00640 [Spirochaetota bacterium]
MEQKTERRRYDLDHENRLATLEEQHKQQNSRLEVLETAGERFRLSEEKIRRLLAKNSELEDLIRRNGENIQALHDKGPITREDIKIITKQIADLDKHLTVLTKVFGLVGSVLMIFVTALIGQMFI